LHENKTHNKINDSDPQLCISSCASNNPPNTAACKLRQERLQELRIVHGTYRKIKHQSYKSGSPGTVLELRAKYIQPLLVCVISWGDISWGGQCIFAATAQQQAFQRYACFPL